MSPSYPSRSGRRPSRAPSAAPTPIPASGVLARVPMRAAIGAVEAAFAQLRAGRIAGPAALGLAARAGTFHVKACAGHGPDGLFVAKVNSNFPGNPERGLPTIQGIVAVFDTAGGRLLALADSASITGLRTAATTAVAVRHLGPLGASRAALVGCGALGPFHLEALEACGLRHVSLVDRVPGRARRLASWERRVLGLDCESVAGIREAALGAQVVVTCTPSRVPVLGRDDVRPGTLVAAVGADNEGKAEIAASLLAEARIVADLAAQCRTIGDLRNAMPGEAGPCAELADAVAGRVPRCGPDEVVVFDSTGLALEDLAVCALLLGRGSATRVRSRSGSPARGAARSRS